MDILAIPTLAGGPVRRDRATTTVGSFALGVFLRAHSNPRNELAGNGPQMPGRFTMSGFEIRGFCQGNWPMALDFVLDSGSTLVITGTTEGALNSIPRFPQRAAVRKLFCNSRPISRRGPWPPSSPSAASRAAVALVYQRVRHPTYAFLGSARATAPSAPSRSIRCDSGRNRSAFGKRKRRATAFTLTPISIGSKPNF